jgi:hypothetical protein
MSGELHAPAALSPGTELQSRDKRKERESTSSDVLTVGAMRMDVLLDANPRSSAHDYRSSREKYVPNYQTIRHHNAKDRNFNIKCPFVVTSKHVDGLILNIMIHFKELV